MAIRTTRSTGRGVTGRATRLSGQPETTFTSENVEGDIPTRGPTTRRPTTRRTTSGHYFTNRPHNVMQNRQCNLPKPILISMVHPLLVNTRFHQAVDGHRRYLSLLMEIRHKASGLCYKNVKGLLTTVNVSLWNIRTTLAPLSFK